MFTQLRSYLDPDRQWRTLATLLHAVFGLLLGFVLLLFGETLVRTLLVVLLVGAAFEVGQTDTVDDLAPEKLGKPGYGFGVMDLLADLAGALLAIGLWLLGGLLRGRLL